MVHFLAPTRFLLALSLATIVAAQAVRSARAETSPSAGPSTAEEALVIDAVVLRPLMEVEAPLQRAGLLTQIAVAEGQRVAKGQLLAALDDRVARRNLAEAKTERDRIHAELANDLRVQYADKALEVARAELARSEESIAEFAGSISQSQLDVERLTVDKLLLERRQAVHDRQMQEFELKLKEHAVAAAALDLELHELRSPIDGVVVLRRAEQGEWVEAGQPVLRLIATDRLRAEGFADADRIGPYQSGDPVALVLEGSTTRRAGRLGLISPEVDPVTHQVRVWAEIDNQAGALRAGLSGALLLPPPPRPAATTNNP